MIRINEDDGIALLSHGIKMRDLAIQIIDLCRRKNHLPDEFDEFKKFLDTIRDNAGDCYEIWMKYKH